jgi:carboxylate-amine ligase
MMVQQNKWRAARFGNRAKLVDTTTYESAPLDETVERLVKKLHTAAAELGCESYLAHCVQMARQPSAAQRQLDLMAETNDPREVVKRLLEASRVSPLLKTRP